MQYSIYQFVAYITIIATLFNSITQIPSANGSSRLKSAESFLGAEKSTGSSHNQSDDAFNIADYASNILLNKEAEETHQDIPSSTISVSRVASSYQSNGSLKNTVSITYTVTNNNFPSKYPEISTHSSITDTTKRISTFDLSKDPNTIKNVVLTNKFKDNVTVSTSSIPFNLSNTGSEYV